jgi:alpha-1,2-glucosyltransferase
MRNALWNRLGARALSAALLVLCHTWVNWRQPDPYMDELFHVPQAARFCASVAKPMAAAPFYDPAITTPPGPYLFPALASVLHPWLCSTRGLRALSALMIWLALPQLAAIIGALRARAPSLTSAAARDTNGGKESDLEALVVLLHPPFFFYAHLFYTDPPALFFLLLCLRMSLIKRHLSSAVCGVIAASCRQTSAVFHGYVAADALITSVYNADPVSNLVRIAAPHAAAGLLYITLFCKNSFRVALGDHIHHPVALHYAMFPYHAGYLLVAVLPLTVFTVSLRRCHFALTCDRSSRFYVLVALLSALALSVTLVELTGDFVHPFALADNRHYTFYVYRRVLLRSRGIRLGLTPLYAAGLIAPFVQIRTWCIGRVSAVSKSFDDESGIGIMHQLRSWLIAETLSEVSLLTAVAICVVPASLLEPRYFVPGFLLTIVRIMSRMTFSPRGLRFCIASLVIANLVVVYAFCELSFPRPMDIHMPDDRSPGRFVF